jgi:hypothetical protein
MYVMLVSFSCFLGMILSAVISYLTWVPSSFIHVRQVRAVGDHLAQIGELREKCVKCYISKQE